MWSAFQANLKYISIESNQHMEPWWDTVGAPTVLQPPNVIAPTGQEQVQKTVSAERGENTTRVGFISATGCRIPPVFLTTSQF